MGRFVSTHLMRRVRLLAPKSRMLYAICRRYVNDYDGECNCDMQSNGELDVMRGQLSGRAHPVAFDVGANCGDWTAAVIQANPSAEVHAFEPSAATFATLQSRNFPPNVVLNKIGVGVERCVRTFNIYGRSSAVNSLFQYDDSRTAVGREEIEILPLSQYCQQKQIESIDYLKIDVEGNEFDVLKGAADLLAEGRIRVIQFEYGEWWIAARVLLKDVLEWVQAQHPYDISKVTPRGLQRILKYGFHLENFHGSNYVLTRRERHPPRRNIEAVAGATVSS